MFVALLQTIVVPQGCLRVRTRTHQRCPHGTSTRRASRVDYLFDKDRLVGSVSYYNGEAAFLLVPIHVGIYLAGSCLVNPALRGLVLAGVLCSMEVAVLMQSRGAMIVTAVSLPIFSCLLVLRPAATQPARPCPRGRCPVRCLSRAPQPLRGVSKREISGLSDRSPRFRRLDDRHRGEALRLSLGAR